MPEIIRVALAYLGYDRLTLELDEETRGQVMRASVVPFFVVLALALQLYVEYRYDSGFAQDLPEFWSRAYRVSFTVASFGTPLAIAVLFVAAMERWSPAGGSWMVLIGLALIVLSLGFGVSAAVLHATSGIEEAFTLRSGTWTNWASTFGFLAVGYLFVAYRAARSEPARRRPRRRSFRERDRSAEAE